PHPGVFPETLPTSPTLLRFPCPCYAQPRALHSFPTRRSSDLRGISPSGRCRYWRRTYRKASHTTSVRTTRTCGGSVSAVTASCADRKSTRLNSSHVKISYAVFCLKKKNPCQQRPPVRTARDPG